MKRVLVLIVLIAGAAGLYVRTTMTQARPTRGLTIEQLIDFRHPSNPMWSPDGRQVAFVWDRAGVSGVYVVEAAGGSAPRELKGAGSQLAGAFWSADGRALMVGKDGDLWRAPIDGGAAAPVWTTPAVESSIVVSPDGTRVAFVRAVTASGSNRVSDRRGAAGPAELWVRTLSDGRETLVSRQEGAITGLGWSPDGTSLIFAAGAHTIRHEQTPPYGGSKIIYTISENVSGELMVVPPAGGTPRPLPAGNGGGFGPRRWIDARHFLVDRMSPDFKRRTTSIVDAGGGEAKLIHEDVEEKFWSMTGDAGAGSQPSPDGKWIAFLSDRDGWDHLYVMPSGGGDPVQITKGKFEAWRPVWSPDGTRIAFDANAPDHYGTRHLYVATLNGNPANASIAAITSGRARTSRPLHRDRRN